MSFTALLCTAQHLFAMHHCTTLLCTKPFCTLLLLAIMYWWDCKQVNTKKAQGKYLCARIHRYLLRGPCTAKLGTASCGLAQIIQRFSESFFQYIGVQCSVR